MENVMEIWGWITENWHIITGVIVGLLGAAKGITSMTKSKSDDEKVKKIEGFFNKFLSLFKKKEDVGDDKPDSK